MTMLRRALALLAVALCILLPGSYAPAGQIGGPLSSSSAGRAAALAAATWAPTALPGAIGIQGATPASSVTNGAAVTSLQVTGANGTLGPTLTGGGSVTWDAATHDLHLADGTPVATLVLPAGTAGSVLGVTTGGAQAATQNTWTASLFFQRNVAQSFVFGARIGTAVTDDEQMALGPNDGSAGFVQFTAAGYGDVVPLDPFGDRVAKGQYHLAMAVLFEGTKYVIVDGEIRDALSGQTVAYPTAAGGGGWGYGGGFSGSAAHNIAWNAWGRAGLDPTLFQGPRWQLERYIAATFPQMAGNRRVVFLGDSQTAGLDDTGPSTNAYPNNPPALLLSRGKLTRSWDVFGGGTGTLFAHTATAGWTTTDLMTTDPAFAGRFPARYIQFGAWTVSGLRPLNVVVIWVGTNDLFGSGGTRLHDPATTHQNVATMAAAARAAGARVVVIGCLPRTQTNTPATYVADFATLNSLYRVNWPNYADAFIDVGNAALFPQLSNPNDGTYYETALVGVHINAAGSAIVADAIAAVLNGFH